MTTATKTPKRHKCRHPYCSNMYDDVVGQKGWTQHASLAGAECIPCLYVQQMLDHNQTIEQIEAIPDVMNMFTELLSKTGWKWQDVKDSYARAKAAR